MTKKQYLGILDTGHDHVEFTYWSTHRANSMANLQDGLDDYARKHGKHASSYTMISSCKIDDEADYCC